MYVAFEQAFADWVIFICSGISSAFYHTCDVGCWCVLQFHVLQVLNVSIIVVTQLNGFKFSVLKLQKGSACFSWFQFMDFWMSFLAVVSTFVYLCNVSEAAKRTMHTIASIISALLALTGATRY